MFSFNKYVKVLLPFAIEQDLVYGVPDEYLNTIQVGKRVEVQMGKNKIYAGLIIETLTTANFPKIKPILSVLDDKPIVSRNHLAFWEWIAEYYLCSLGEVMQAALPALFKLDSLSEYIWTGEEIDERELNFEEWSLYKIFNIHQKLSVQEIKKYYSKSSITTLLSKWQKNGWIERVEVFSEKYKDKKEKYVMLSELANADIDKTHESLTSDKQKEILEFLLIKQIEGEEKVSKKNIMAQEFSTSAYNTLIKKGFLLELEEKVDRVSSENRSEIIPLELSVFQTHIYQEIQSRLQENKPYLLFGVTASGKTMIYIKMALDAIAEGKQMLWLLPEIALTTQIIDKVRKYISKFLVFHSRFNNAEQAEIWEKVQEESSLLILGTRSAVFLPFSNLGLIIVDEEHDASYKQTNPSPRYHVRDASVYMALHNKIPIVLGSATPSIESYYNAEKQKYTLINMDKRYSDTPAPEVFLVDIIRSKKKKQYDGLLTQELKEAIQHTLTDKNKIILFHNRRGYAPYMQCDACAYIPMCKHCDVSLTYHKYLNVLLCHYCGYKEKVPHSCPSCSHQQIEIKGMGTQRIEEEISLRYRDHHVGRMDYDTTRGKWGHSKVIQDFESGKWDILVGTQMVTKGLDFDEVTLVGVLNTDMLFTIPEYKTIERAYQLLVQVIGRAGRKTSVGKVFLQTSNPKHPLFEKVLKLDYLSFYQEQIEERKYFLYPPFVKLIKLVIKNKDKIKLDEEARDIADKIRENSSLLVLGPVEPILSKMDNYYLLELFVKVKRDKELNKNKLFVKEIVRGKRSSYISIDVDN